MRQFSTASGALCPGRWYKGGASIVLRSQLCSRSSEARRVRARLQQRNVCRCSADEEVITVEVGVMHRAFKSSDGSIAQSLRLVQWRRPY